MKFYKKTISLLIIIVALLTTVALTTGAKIMSPQCVKVHYFSTPSSRALYQCPHNTDVVTGGNLTTYIATATTSISPSDPCRVRAEINGTWITSNGSRQTFSVTSGWQGSFASIDFNVTGIGMILDATRFHAWG